MKKIMIAALGLSMLSGTVVFAQNTATGSDTMSSTMTKKKHHKTKKHKGSDTMSSTTATSTK